MGFLFRFAEILPVQDHGRSKFFAITDFDERRVLRHHDRRRNAEQFPLVSERLGVVPGGGGNYAALLLVRRQLGEGVARAAFLKTPSALLVIELGKDLHPGEFAQRDGFRTRGIINSALDALSRGLNFLERDGVTHNRSYKTYVTYASRAWRIFAASCS